jgi:cytochrome b6-f complex iron-sulfur subunit
MSRTVFKNIALVIVALVITSTSCRNRDTVPRVDFTLDLTLPENQTLNAIGGTVQVPQYSIVVGKGFNGYFAVTNFCTLHNCTLEYQSFSDELKCPCSSCLFNTQGGVTQGPATNPLIQYATQLNGQWLRVYSP